VLSVLNISTGALQFSLLYNAYHFPKAKMEDDFNENYIESDKYPKSTFKGTITDVSSFSSLKDGSYPVNVKGDLMIHGISKNITAPGTVTIKDGKISATSTFKVLLKDYKIGIPTIVTNKISESIEITVNCNYEKK
jgi:polyisoprenoid-binding protein YceI